MQSIMITLVSKKNSFMSNNNVLNIDLKQYESVSGEFFLKCIFFLQFLVEVFGQNFHFTYVLVLFCPNFIKPTNCMTLSAEIVCKIDPRSASTKVTTRRTSSSTTRATRSPSTSSSGARRWQKSWDRWYVQEQAL
jgi:hypothetical protein